MSPLQATLRIDGNQYLLVWASLMLYNCVESVAVIN